MWSEGSNASGAEHLSHVFFCSTNEEKRGNLCTIKKQLCAPNGALLRNSLKCETPITLGGILFYIRVYKQKKESFFWGAQGLSPAMFRVGLLGYLLCSFA